MTTKLFWVFVFHKFKQMSVVFDTRPFDERIAESKKMLKMHPEKRPVLIQPQGTETPKLGRAGKFSVSLDATPATLKSSIRKVIPQLKPSDAIILIIKSPSDKGEYKSIMPMDSEEFGTLYEAHKHADGFMYMTYSVEATFG